MIRILICDDQEIVCDGLEAVLDGEDDFEVVGMAHDGAQAVEAVEELQPDLVLMDLKMPGMNGVQATRIIKEKYPDTFILVLTTYEDDAWLFDAIRSGAAGYLLKDSSRDTLIASIRGTVGGETHVDPHVAGRLFDKVAHTDTPAKSNALDVLSEREREVLILMARGYSNASIAEELHLSLGTVRNYITSTITKLDVEDRTQAALLALRYGLIE